MMFADEPAQWRGWTIEILGTDVSKCAVERARRGTYSQFEVQRGLAVTQMINWFEESGDGWRIAEPLRTHVRFEVHNMLEPPPQPGRVRHHPVPQRPALFLAGEEALAFDRLSRRSPRTAG